MVEVLLGWADWYWMPVEWSAMTCTVPFSKQQESPKDIHLQVSLQQRLKKVIRALSQESPDHIQIYSQLLKVDLASRKGVTDLCSAFLNVETQPRTLALSNLDNNEAVVSLHKGGSELSIRNREADCHGPR